MISHIFVSITLVLISVGFVMVLIILGIFVWETLKSALRTEQLSKAKWAKKFKELEEDEKL